MELGWTCAGGTNAANDVCTAICGDGWIRGTEVCDDGNGDAGDGCDGCLVETGWICHSEPSTCYKITIPTIESTYINDGMFATTWNETVILDTNWNNASFSVKIEGPLTPYTITFYTYSNDTLLAGTKNLTTWWGYSLNW